MSNREGQSKLLDHVLPKLRPFQRAAFEVATQGKSDAMNNSELLTKGRLLIGDEMGLGKTVTSLAIMAHYETEWPLLIICPSSLRYTWPAEIEKFFPRLSPHSIYVAKGFQDVVFAKRKDVKIVILTYSLFQERSAVQETIKEIDFHCVIVDESHNLKSRSSQRTQFIMPILQRAHRLLLLSGTPALARPAELWPQLSCLAPKLFGNWTTFSNQYCNPRRKFFGGGRFTMDYSGSSNEAELHTKLQKVMIRRLKNDVLHELPPKQRAIVPVTVGGREELAHCKRVMAELAEKRVSIADLVSEDARKADWEARSKLMEAYQVSGIGKASAVADYLLDWLDGTSQKILVFAHHKAVLDKLDKKLLEKFPNSHVRIDGDVDPMVRAQLVKKFQQCERVRVALLSVTAAGVGLTLTAASTVMFAELHWTPGVLAQAEDRAHRIGQQHQSVQILYMVCKDPKLSIDMSLWKQLGRKIHTIDQVIDGKKETPYIFNADEKGADQLSKRSVTAQDELTDFFAHASDEIVDTKAKNYAKGSIESFFKKASKEIANPVTGNHGVSTVESRKRRRVESLHEKLHFQVTCKVCTLVNTITNVDENSSCQACGNMLDNDLVQWNCASCTLLNEETRTGSNRYICAACGEPYAPRTGRLEKFVTPASTKKQPLSAKVTEDIVTVLRKRSNPLLSEVGGMEAPIDLCSPVRARTLADKFSSVEPGFSSHDVALLDDDREMLIQRARMPTDVSSPEVIVVEDIESSSGQDCQKIIKEKEFEPLLEFSVSKNSGRVAIHIARSGESSPVNFQIEEVIASNGSDPLLLARGEKVGTAEPSKGVAFNDNKIRTILLEVVAENSALSMNKMAFELKDFVSKYLRLRSVEQKMFQEAGKPLSADKLSRFVANMILPSKDCVDRYVGGAKERAQQRQAQGVASRADLAVIDGRSCAWCGNNLSLASQKTGSTYCSQGCAEEGRLRRGGFFASVHIRSAMFALEGGVCTKCGIDAHALFGHIRALKPPERLNKLLSSNWSMPKSGRALEKLLNDPKEGDFWQVDHIRAVAEGGGDSSLDNLRTLCVPCHKHETASLLTRLRKGSSRPQPGQTDIRSHFQTSQTR